MYVFGSREVCSSDGDEEVVRKSYIERLAVVDVTR